MRWWIYVSIILAGVLIAYLMVGELGGAFFVSLAVSVVFIWLLFKGLVCLLMRIAHSDPIAIEYRKIEADVARLSLEDAKKLAEAALSKTNTFRCTQATGTPPENILGLKNSVVSIFEKYQTIECEGTTNVFGWEYVKPSSLRSGYTQVGADIDDRTEFAVIPGQEELYLITGYEHSEDDILKQSSPSIYHWIILHDRL